MSAFASVSSQSCVVAVSALDLSHSVVMASAVPSIPGRGREAGRPERHVRLSSARGERSRSVHGEAARLPVVISATSRERRRCDRLSRPRTQQRAKGGHHRDRRLQRAKRQERGIRTAAASPVPQEGQERRQSPGGSQMISASCVRSSSLAGGAAGAGSLTAPRVDLLSGLALKSSVGGPQRPGACPGSVARAARGCSSTDLLGRQQLQRLAVSRPHRDEVAMVQGGEPGLSQPFHQRQDAAVHDADLQVGIRALKCHPASDPYERGRATDSLATSAALRPSDERPSPSRGRRTRLDAPFASPRRRETMKSTTGSTSDSGSSSSRRCAFSRVVWSAGVDAVHPADMSAAVSMGAWSPALAAGVADQAESPSNGPLRAEIRTHPSSTVAVRQPLTKKEGSASDISQTPHPATQTTLSAREAGHKEENHI
jgi:hypothetical protein